MRLQTDCNYILENRSFLFCYIQKGQPKHITEQSGIVPNTIPDFLVDKKLYFLTICLIYGRITLVYWDFLILKNFEGNIWQRPKG